jgi:hypothetical protein
MGLILNKKSCLLHVSSILKKSVVTDELKKVQKRDFGQLIRNCTTAQKPTRIYIYIYIYIYITMGLILNKKVVSSSCVFDFKKVSRN